MTLRLHTAILTAFLGFSSAAGAQQANPLDVIPDKMPFNTPYGAPISLTRAQAAIAAATRRGGEPGLGAQCRRRRFRGQSRRLRAHGRRAARLDRRLRNIRRARR